MGSWSQFLEGGCSTATSKHDWNAADDGSLHGHAIWASTLCEAGGSRSPSAHVCWERYFQDFLFIIVIWKWSTCFGNALMTSCSYEWHHLLHSTALVSTGELPEQRVFRLMARVRFLLPGQFIFRLWLYMWVSLWVGLVLYEYGLIGDWVDWLLFTAAIPEEAVDGSRWTSVEKGICCICCDKQINSLLYRFVNIFLELLVQLAMQNCVCKSKTFGLGTCNNPGETEQFFSDQMWMMCRYVLSQLNCFYCYLQMWTHVYLPGLCKWDGVQ